MSVLDGFTTGTVTYDGQPKTVHRRGDGPGVVVVHEMPGITPSVAAFGRRVADRGFTVVMPSLFGTDGRAPSGAYLAATAIRACVSREFTCFATGRSSPAARWLRALAADLHDELGGPGVGAVGMCFTGGFALAMMVEDAVAAPVLSQPSLPLAVGRRRARSVGLSDDEILRVAARAEEGCPVLGLRFTEDRAVPAARFEALREILGDAFVAVEIDSSPGNPWGIPRRAHSVLTEDLVDEPGHPTREALERVLGFFEERLR
ncbi:MAG: dienelactone hydrolase family protein [Acidimicrobiia bacterium]|nr:dienelactone hydrolase family protein [Acidimicrobiia bacterium]